MKNTFAFVLLASLALPAAAHDPAMHAKDGKATTADCSQMKGMDMSKMDMNDPVMKAMHEKCMGAMKHDADHDHGHGKTPADKNAKPTDKSHDSMKEDMH